MLEAVAAQRRARTAGVPPGAGPGRSVGSPVGVKSGSQTSSCCSKRDRDLLVDVHVVGRSQPTMLVVSRTSGPPRARRTAMTYGGSGRSPGSHGWTLTVTPTIVPRPDISTGAQVRLRQRRADRHRRMHQLSRSPSSPGCAACHQRRIARTTRSPGSARGAASCRSFASMSLALGVDVDVKVRRHCRVPTSCSRKASRQCTRRHDDRYHDRSDARRPHPRGRRAHVRARGVGSAVRLGRRGHQDRARRARRRDARRWPRPASLPIPSDVHILLEHSNRGKQSLGLDLTSPTTAWTSSTSSPRRADVFLTNKLPGVREQAEDRRSRRSAQHNPNIIYVRGTGQGERGPGCRQGFLRRAGLLGPLGLCAEACMRRSTTEVAGAAGARFRRLHRGDDHRRRDDGRALPPRAHR